MSEYQYYEFAAIDRRLTEREMEQLRAISSRAEITSTSFSNVYNWGSFGGDPLKMMHKYFDAFIHVANWGTHQLMLRLPRALIDEKTMSLYCAGEFLSLDAKGENAILDFSSQEVEGDWEEGGQGELASMVPLRDGLMRGDLRALYIGWLAGLQSGEIDDDEVEPPVPPGLKQLTGPLQALADFLRVDQDLLAAAAERSEDEVPAGDNQQAMAKWLAELPAMEKDILLLRLANGDPFPVQRDLLQGFREARPQPEAAPTAGGRKVAELLAAAEDIGEVRKKAEAERRAAAAARRAREAAAERVKHLDRLQGREDELWRQVESHVNVKPARYDEAIKLLVDLKDLAARAGVQAGFADHLSHFRERHARKYSLVEKLNKLGSK